MREAREVQTPRFKIDDLGQEVPDVRAEAAIIYNPETNQVLWESNAQDQRSIASITKVMTALVFLESGMPMTTPVSVVRSDVYRASTTYLRNGYQVTADDLMNLLLIGSDNAAARALARISPYGSAGFIDQMNQKASDLGLTQTHYSDPSGLLAANVSSAYDMARLIAFAAADERIGAIMRKATHTVQAGKRTINVASTNHLVRSGEFDVLGGKTGFISQFGLLHRQPASSAADGSASRGRRSGRQVESGALLGDPTLVQLDELTRAEAARHRSTSRAADRGDGTLRVVTQVYKLSVVSSKQRRLSGAVCCVRTSAYGRQLSNSVVL